MNNIRLEMLEDRFKRLDEMIQMELGQNPYMEIENSLKIIQQKNINQIPTINRKLKDFIIRIYNRRMANMDSVIQLTNEIKDILNGQGK